MSGIWQVLQPEEKRLIVDNFTVHNFKKNQIIYSEGDTPEHLWCLFKGKVKKYKDGVGGRVQILRLIRPVQYFGYRMTCPAQYIWTALFGVLSFGSVAFFSWGQLYEGYASLMQILINIAFCCILLRGSILQKIFVSAFTMGLVAVIATFTALLVAKLSGNNVALLLSRFNSVRIISILITKLLFFVITRIFA